MACLFVVLYHSVLLFLYTSGTTRQAVATPILELFQKLSIGVPLFFVISGYCIAAAADGTRRRGDSIKIYFFRRFRRIYPPLWIVILLSVVFFLVVDVMIVPGLLSRPPWPQLRPWWYSPSQWLGNLTLTETWRYHLVGSSRGHFPGQAWTLCYEEQFYAVVGALLLLRQRFFHGVTAVTVVTIAIMLAAKAAQWDIEGFFFDGYWLTFAAGVLLYHTTNYGSARQFWIAAAALAVTAMLSPVCKLPGGISGFGFALLLLLTHRFDHAIATWRAGAPIRRCGEMCYSLYLVHQIPVKATSALLLRAGVNTSWGTLFVTVPACVAVSVVAGWYFHCWVERRFLNTPSVRSRSLPVVVGVAHSRSVPT